MKNMLLALVLLPVVLGVRPVHAIPIEVTFSFTARDFVASDSNFSAPFDPVAGTVKYVDDAGTLSLTSLSLGLVKNFLDFGNERPYNKNDVDEFVSTGGKLVIGAFDDRALHPQVRSGHDDFIFQWDPATGVLESFDYASVSAEGSTFHAGTLISGNPVSEPTTLPLAVLAMGLIALFAGRHRSRPTIAVSG